MKKMVAPVVISVIMIAYFVLYFGFLRSLFESILVKLLLGVIPLAFSAVMIFVCVQRMKEIRSGEEDDLGKY